MKDNMTKGNQLMAQEGCRHYGHFQGLYQSDYEHDACGVGMVV